METPTLSVTSRAEKGRKNYTVRAEGNVPAVVYGAGMKPAHVSVEGTTFDRMYKEAGESTLLDLVIDEAKPIKVLIQDIQRDPVLGNAIHVDFRHIDMNKPVVL